MIQTEEHAALHAHHAFLKLTYITASVILYYIIEIHGIIPDQARYAALEMAGIVQSFDHLGIAQYLPLNGITVFLPLIVTMWHDVRCKDHSSTTGLHQSC
jgi:hypothetical protein